MATPKAAFRSPPGECKFTLAAAALGGDVIPRPSAVSGTSIGVVAGLNSDIFTTGTPVTLQTVGCFEIEAITGTAFTDDQLLYWDDTAKKITNVVGTNSRAGRCVGAKLSAANKCIVNLNVV